MPIYTVVLEKMENRTYTKDVDVLATNPAEAESIAVSLANSMNWEEIDRYTIDITVVASCLKESEE